VKTIVLTVESKIYNPNQDLLVKYGTLQQTLSRKLFNILTDNNTYSSQLKKQLLKDYHIHARLLNAIHIDVKGSQYFRLI